MVPDETPCSVASHLEGLLFVYVPKIERERLIWVNKMFKAMDRMHSFRYDECYHY